MGVFTDSIQKYAPILEKVFGGVNDLVVKNRFADAEESLQKMRDAKVNYDRFQKINKRLRGAVIPPQELYTATGDYDFNTTNDLLNTTNAVQEYRKTLQPTVITNPDGTTTEQPPQYSGDTFKQWLGQNPQHMQELADLNYVKPKFNKLGDEEVKNMMYKKAGLTPEDVQFYDTWKKQNFDVTDHNTKLQSMILDYVPGLTSKGQEGDKLAKLFQQKAGMLGIDDGKNSKYSYLNLKDGKLLRYTDDGSYEIVDYGLGNEKDMKNNPEKWQVEQRGDKYYWAYDEYDPKTDSSKLKLIRELSGTELADYLASKEAGDIKLDKLKNPQKYSRSTRGYKPKGSKTKDPLDEFMEKMSDIGLKNNGKEFNSWDEKERKVYTDAMNSVRTLTGKTDQEIWDMVGSYEKTKYKQDGSNLSQQEQYDLNDDVNAAYDMYNMDDWWDKLYNVGNESDFTNLANYYSGYLAKELKNTKAIPKDVGAKLWSIFENSKSKVWNDLNSGGRFK